MSDNINTKSITKKCGEIIITMKRNAEKAYSFNCWFCGTIYIQMKKFTLHLEQEHIPQLEHYSDVNALSIDDGASKSQLWIHEAETDPDSIFVTEIKIEDTGTTDIKKESCDDSNIMTRADHKVFIPIILIIIFIIIINYAIIPNSSYNNSQVK